MSRLRAVSLACRSVLQTTTRVSVPCRTSRWCEQSYRQLCARPSKQAIPNTRDLYKALTRRHPPATPDLKLTSLLQSAQNSNDPDAAINALTSNVTTNRIHHIHVTSAIQLCLPSKPQLAESLLSTLTGSLPDHILTPARALLARYYTSRNEPQTALATINFPIQLLSEPPLNLRNHVHSLHLGTIPAAWGVIIKSLTQLNYPSHACAIVDEALHSRVPVTDAMLHLCIYALRADNRWQQANTLFESTIARGLRPSERTVGSLLLTLTGQSARTEIDRRRVIEVVDIVQSPSMKFLNLALAALTSVGAFLRAERVFVELVNNGIVEEHMFAKMMAGLGNFLQLLPVTEVDTIDASTYSRISERGDELWDTYLRKFPRGRHASSMLSKLLRVKTRCFRHGEGVDVLERVVKDGRGDILDITHIAAVMGAVELACDVREMKRLMEVMERVGLRHDMRSLAFCLGTLIGDGNLTEAVSMVRSEAPQVIEDNEVACKEYYPILLLRRLRTLIQALQDAGVGRFADVEQIIELVEQKHNDYQGKQVG